MMPLLGWGSRDGVWGIQWVPRLSPPWGQVLTDGRSHSSWEWELPSGPRGRDQGAMPGPLQTFPGSAPGHVDPGGCPLAQVRSPRRPWLLAWCFLLRVRKGLAKPSGAGVPDLTPH